MKPWKRNAVAFHQLSNRVCNAMDQRRHQLIIEVTEALRYRGTEVPLKLHVPCRVVGNGSLNLLKEGVDFEG